MNVNCEGNGMDQQQADGADFHQSSQLNLVSNSEARIGALSQRGLRDNEDGEPQRDQAAHHQTRFQ